MAYKRRGKMGNGVGAVIAGVTALGITLLVGNSILTSVGTTIGNITSTPFYSALSFLGMDDTGGTWSTTGIVGILALAAVAGFVLYWVRKSLKM